MRNMWFCSNMKGQAWCDALLLLLITYFTQLRYSMNIQGVPGGIDKTSGECSLC